MTELPLPRQRLDTSDSLLLETLLLEAPVAFAFYDTELRYRRINRALADFNALPIEAHIGHRPSEVLEGPLGLAVEAMLRRVLDTGEVIIDPDFSAEDPVSREERHFSSSWYPARSGAEVIGVAVLVSDVTDRRRAEAALRASQQRTEELQRATAELAGALRVDEVVERIGAIGQRAVGADWSGVALIDGPVLRFVPGRAEPTGLARAWPEVPRALPSPVTEAVRREAPLYLSSREELRALLPHPHIRDYVDGSTEQAWALLPLASSGEPLGVLRFAFDEPRRLDRDERAFLEALAGQCALAMERAQLFEREHRTAVTLQRSLLPAQLPQESGLDLAARYLPAVDGAAVGGDWYDAFPLSDGRVAVVVGDVMGKGVIAAAGMGRVRHALRALAYVDPSPAAVLTGLDRLFTATEQPEQLTTVVYAVIDPSSGEVEMSDAGHLPVVVQRASGERELVDAGPQTTPLGVAEPRAQRTMTLGPGDTLVAFTDGLVESRRQPLDDGLRRLQQSLGEHPGDALPHLLGHVLADLAGEQANADDVTILAVRRPA